jgi:hypothetical protein
MNCLTLEDGNDRWIAANMLRTALKKEDVIYTVAKA